MAIATKHLSTLILGVLDATNRARLRHLAKQASSSAVSSTSGSAVPRTACWTHVDFRNASRPFRTRRTLIRPVLTSSSTRQPHTLSRNLVGSIPLSYRTSLRSEFASRLTASMMRSASRAFSFARSALDCQVHSITRPRPELVEAELTHHLIVRHAFPAILLKPFLSLLHRLPVLIG